MNNLNDKPWSVLFGAIIVLLAGIFMVLHAPNMFIFSAMMLFIGKVSIAVGATFTVLALYFLRV